MAILRRMPDEPTPTAAESTGLLARVRAAARGAVAALLFERRHRLDTTDWVELSDVGLADPERADYKPTGWLTLKRILPPEEVTADDVFVDLGSGKGRAVFLAAQYPFRRVIGVELSRELHAVAEKNLRRYDGRFDGTRIELVNADVLEYELPPDVTVVFLFNPFNGSVFAGALANVLRSLDEHPRPLRLIYVNPVEEAQVVASGRARLVREVSGADPPDEAPTSARICLFELR
jgi:SAM-dependent methyltransferase